MTTKTNQCCDCRNGDHENYDNDIILVVIKDPETGKLVKRGRLCGEHRAMYRTDGYSVIGD